MLARKPYIELPPRPLRPVFEPRAQVGRSVRFALDYSALRKVHRDCESSSQQRADECVLDNGADAYRIPIDYEDTVAAETT
jgi:hypothetical protein